MRCVLLIVMILDFFDSQCEMVNDKEYKSDDSRGRFSWKEEHNATLYLGYSNNPFGLSTPLDIKSEKSKNAASTVSDFSANYLPNDDSSEFRHKRGVVHLYNMVSCATGCNPLIYKGYGCFCGFLGSGYPVDGVDRCCKQHDWCYNTARCPLFLEYFVPYYWRCYKGRPICAINHPHLGNADHCSQRLCECDKILSECLRKFPCPSSRARCKSSPIRLLQNTLMIF